MSGWRGSRTAFATDSRVDRKPMYSSNYRVQNATYSWRREIQAAHVTAFGLCLHDFAVTPCPYHLNCVRGCADYLRTKGSSGERHRLVQIQRGTEPVLASAMARGAVAKARIAHCEETLDGVRKALAVDEDPY